MPQVLINSPETALASLIKAVNNLVGELSQGGTRPPVLKPGYEAPPLFQPLANQHDEQPYAAPVINYKTGEIDYPTPVPQANYSGQATPAPMVNAQQHVEEPYVAPTINWKEKSY